MRKTSVQPKRRNEITNEIFSCRNAGKSDETLAPLPALAALRAKAPFSVGPFLLFSPFVGLRSRGYCEGRSVLEATLQDGEMSLRRPLVFKATVWSGHRAWGPRMSSWQVVSFEGIQRQR